MKRLASTNLIFLLIFTLFLEIGESWAVKIPDEGVSGTCNNDGTCLWNLDSAGKLTISAAAGAENVKMRDYTCSGNNCSTTNGNRPWENYLQEIKSVEVGDNITRLGNNAFQAAHNLTTVTGMKDVTDTGENGTFNFTGLTSIDLPSVTHIGSYAFAHNEDLIYIGLPDEHVTIADNAFSNTRLSGCSGENRSACGSCGEKFVQAGVGCVDKCYKDYMPCSGYCCLRTRYTLPEADAATSDDFENTIEWIFE
ncbi:MAG: leucine-rich repeat domain-containing protein [Alphaproteobacteria bacterium]|nr:leucine-rich repeat domain-containing protein [Alphaproteobacteria bacterium]